MYWFEHLTGLREGSYQETRAKLKVDGERLQSLVNGKGYGIGRLKLISHQILRKRATIAGGSSGRLTARVVKDDIRQMGGLVRRRALPGRFSLQRASDDGPRSGAGTWGHPIPA
jgi:hypothetical protein